MFWNSTLLPISTVTARDQTFFLSYLGPATAPEPVFLFPPSPFVVHYAHSSRMVLHKSFYIIHLFIILHCLPVIIWRSLLQVPPPSAFLTSHLAAPRIPVRRHTCFFVSFTHPRPMWRLILMLFPDFPICLSPKQFVAYFRLVLSLIQYRTVHSLLWLVFSLVMFWD